MTARTYAQRRARRQQQREREQLGETLAAYHARETAKPATLAEVYADNHRNREWCPWSRDLEEMLEVKHHGR